MTRAVRFAVRVARRYGRRPGRPRPLRTVLLRRPWPFVVHGGSSVVVSRRIELAVRSGPAVLTETRPDAPSSSRVETVAPPASPRAAATTVATGTSEQVVQRLLERTTRVEADVWRTVPLSGRASREPSPPVLSRPSAPPLELVVARPAAAPAPPSPSAAAPPALEGWGPPQPFAQRAPQPPKIDVEALTDRVMHSIDRRIVAYRERTGRV